MKAAELEQRLNECTFRLSKIEQQLKDKEEENAELKNKISAMEQKLENGDGASFNAENAENDEIIQLGNRIQNLSDELYGHITNQVSGINGCMNANIESINNRIQNLSDELYGYILKQVNQKQIQYEEINKKISSSVWNINFGMDTLVSDMQLALVESKFQGNREKLEKMADTHKGEACFVIGNGPSLDARDLDKIMENNYFTFASKGIYNIFGETEWRPDVWMASDLDYIESKLSDINNIECGVKMICTQAFLRKNLKVDNAIYFPFIQCERNPRSFVKDITKGIHFYGTVTGKLIELATYMGFNTIYLLGVDNNYPTKILENGVQKVDVNKVIHFSKNYLSEKEYEKAANAVTDFGKAIDYMDESYRQIDYECKNIGVKIYNATRGGNLDAYERINFDDIM